MDALDCCPYVFGRAVDFHSKEEMPLEPLVAKDVELPLALDIGNRTRERFVAIVSKTDAPRGLSGRVFPSYHLERAGLAAFEPAQIFAGILCEAPPFRLFAGKPEDLVGRDVGYERGNRSIRDPMLDRVLAQRIVARLLRDTIQSARVLPEEPGLFHRSVFTGDEDDRGARRGALGTIGNDCVEGMLIHQLRYLQRLADVAAGAVQKQHRKTMGQRFDPVSRLGELVRRSRIDDAG